MCTSIKIISLWIFLLGGLAVLPVGAQGPNGNSVLLFQGPNASGAMQEIPAGTYRVDGKQLGAKDAVFSVLVPIGIKVRFCEEAGANGEGAGKCEEYGEGTHNLLSLNFMLIRVSKETTAPAVSPVAPQSVPSSSPSRTGTPPIPVSTQPPVVVYEQLNWGGRSQIFVPGMYRSIRGEFGKINDNQAMSVIVAKGFHARFCVDAGVYFRGSGDCEEHDEGRFNLRFADSISFIEVTDRNDHSPPDDSLPVVLYEDASQGGKKQGFDVGIFLASLNQLGKLGNDKASSVNVKNGYRVLVCADEIADGGGTDKCEELGPGKHNLKEKGVASYVKVTKADK